MMRVRLTRILKLPPWEAVEVEVQVVEEEAEVEEDM